PRQPCFSPTGAIASILALAWLAPPAVAGGCAHNVTSRSDPARLASLIGTLISDLAVRTDPSSAPPMPRPCAGAWCSGQPAVPLATVGAGGTGSDSWAWNPPLGGRVSVDPSFLSTEADGLNPLCWRPAVFRPPRPFPST